MLELPTNANQNNELEEKTSSELVPLNNNVPTISVEMTKKNIILVTNAIRLVGTCASFIEEKFTMFLNRVLFDLLEKAGAPYVLVAHAAQEALKKVAVACGYELVSELIEKSVPYFWFTLSQKLKRLPEFPSSPQVLRFVLQSQRGEVKTFIEELVEDALHSLDSFHGHSTDSVLTMLLNFVEAVGAERTKENSAQQLAESNVESKSLCEFLADVHRSHEELENEIKEVEPDTLSAKEGFQKHWEEKNSSSIDNEKENDVQEKTPNIPKQINLVVQILEKCSYLLFIKNRKTQLIILEIVKRCCSVLREWEDQKLPCFHKIWKPLALRLKDKDFVVILKALETCVFMVIQSENFLRKRFLQEVYPSLLHFLGSQSSASLNRNSKDSFYPTSIAFKTQRNVLENIPELTRSLNFDVMECGELLDAIIPYLDNRQPEILQHLALEVLSTVKDLHPDLVWISLASLKGSFRITSPSHLLPHVVVSICGLRFGFFKI